MSPKAAYWSHFSIDGVTATCMVGGCRNYLGLPFRYWEKQEPSLKAKGPVGEALLAVVKRLVFCSIH